MKKFILVLFSCLFLGISAGPKKAGQNADKFAGSKAGGVFLDAGSAGLNAGQNAWKKQFKDGAGLAGALEAPIEKVTQSWFSKILYGTSKESEKLTEEEAQREQDEISQIKIALDSTSEQWQQAIICEKFESITCALEFMKANFDAVGSIYTSEDEVRSVLVTYFIPSWAARHNVPVSVFISPETEQKFTLKSPAKETNQTQMVVKLGAVFNNFVKNNKDRINSEESKMCPNNNVGCECLTNIMITLAVEFETACQLSPVCSSQGVSIKDTAARFNKACLIPS